MFYCTIIVGLFISGVLETSARAQYQCTVPCAVTQPVCAVHGQQPTLNIVVRSDSQERPPSEPCQSPPPLSPCYQPAPRRFCSSVCALPGAIMDSILSGEVNI